LGSPVYVQLYIPTLSTPFYHVNTIPGDKSVTFQISIVDTEMVMVNGRYKVKVFYSTGEEVPLETNTFLINTPAKIVVNNIPKDEKAILKLYSVYDMNNTGRAFDDTILPDIKDVPPENLDAGLLYLKLNCTGYPLGDKGYDLGNVQMSQSSSERARINFTNSVNLDEIKYIRYVVVNEAGLNYSYSEMFTKQPEGISTDYYYELSHKFTTLGKYLIQVRFYDEAMSQLDDVTLTYYKNY
jgi:hypothetical protein